VVVSILAQQLLIEAENLEYLDSSAICNHNALDLNSAIFPDTLTVLAATFGQTGKKANR